MKGGRKVVQQRFCYETAHLKEYFNMLENNVYWPPH